MVDPVSFEEPETLVGMALQANDEGDKEEFKSMLVDVPEQIVEESGVAVTTGFGLTVTTEGNTGPRHPEKIERIL